jgi:hypothetical protein
MLRISTALSDIALDMIYWFEEREPDRDARHKLINETLMEHIRSVNGGGKLGRWGGVKLYHLA